MPRQLGTRRLWLLGGVAGMHQGACIIGEPQPLLQSASLLSDSEFLKGVPASGHHMVFSNCKGGEHADHRSNCTIVFTFRETFFYIQVRVFQAAISFSNNSLLCSSYSLQESLRLRRSSSS
eukprot:Blabericola_migrator_1__7271@NODE_3694_length_1570_cov_24_065868_g2292_i0_p1_GENE_NODE_3694_length_1570_cov_24_065868_g2292_i0NODE_3694_length_1570_cov_24_065868_g2292_i0_p1_ORF_typecomplete_len121_score12_12_NODE_3694_length_1570_cov_24_065868_g2292_i057419